MDHAEAHELGVLEPGNQPQHARLLAPLHLRLEADQAEVIAGEVVLPQLHDGVGLAAGARIGRGRPASSARTAACPRRDAPSPRSAGSLRRTSRCRSRAARAFSAAIERLVERAGTRRGERAVQVVPFAVVHAARRTGRLGGLRRLPAGRRGRVPRRLRPQREARNTFDRSIDLGQDDRADGVVEIEVLGADERGDVGGQRVGRQRPVAMITGPSRPRGTRGDLLADDA